MAVCKICEDPLVLRLEDEDEDEDEDNVDMGNRENDNEEQETIPDDLELSCDCHFHWQCLMDESPAIAISLQCPSCGTSLISNQAGPSATNTFLHTSSGTAILANYTNEGGTEHGLDLLPRITEEAYLEGNPEARPARAFHTMCSEGDVAGIVELLRDTSSSSGQQQGRSSSSSSGVEGETAAALALLRYQDPLAEMRSGLHLALLAGQEEVVWLLLWLASRLPSSSFPLPSVQAASAMGIGRLAVGPEGDVRNIRDGSNALPEDVARRMGGQWQPLLDAGGLTP